MTIDEARKQIDAIDNQIVELFGQRMDLCREIGILKGESQSSVDVPGRERAIVNRLTSSQPDDRKVFVKELYNTIFNISKAYQNQFVKRSSPLVAALKQAVTNQSPAPLSARVACQGVEGAYSGIAADRLFVAPDLTFFKTFEGVFAAIDKGLCDYGVLPIENSNTGSITQVYDLMQKNCCYIVKAIRLPVKHALVAKAGVKLKDIKKVISHEQGLLQCAEYLKKLGVETQAVANTAVAAAAVREGGDDTVAAICSEESAEIYGLQIVKSNIQDNSNNFTRFICISKNLQIFSGANKMSVMINLSHTPGSLNRLLGRFAALNLNLTKLESRPISNSNFEFMFYFDFDGDVGDERVLGLLADLEAGSQQFVFLGSYKDTL